MGRVLNLESLANLCHDNLLIYFDPRHYKSTATVEIVRDIAFPSEPLVVGVFGSAFEAGNIPQHDMGKVNLAVREIADELAKYGSVVVVTGACPDGSIPTEVVRQIKGRNQTIPIIGISPWRDFEEAQSKARSVGKQTDLLRPTHDWILYSDFGNYRMRDGLTCTIVNGALAIRGSTGTHDEIAGLYEEGKVVGRLKGYAGSADVQEAVVESFAADGKHHYVDLPHTNARELTRRVIGQIAVDSCLRSGRETSTIDVYAHTPRNGSPNPALNLRRFRRRNPQIDWRQEHDRPYPFTHYNRSDLSHAGKLLLGLPRYEARQYVEELLGATVTEVPHYRPGEVGILMFPTQKGIRVPEAIQIALQLIAEEFRHHVLYFKQPTS
ncbi:MAG TPA: hypothetical protein VJH97_04915 [Candidatus Nanoarchaeia archaeon]|nr:hypothetical protein [Candidatus Nanoarchaeia archaeon]